MKDVTDQYALSGVMVRDYTLLSVHESVAGPLCVQYGEAGGKDYFGVISDPDKSLRLEGLHYSLMKRRTLDGLRLELGADFIASGWDAGDFRFEGGHDRWFFVRFCNRGVKHRVESRSEAKVIAAVDKIRAE